MVDIIQNVVDLNDLTFDVGKMMNKLSSLTMKLHHLQTDGKSEKPTKNQE